MFVSFIGRRDAQSFEHSRVAFVDDRVGEGEKIELEEEGCKIFRGFIFVLGFATF